MYDRAVTANAANDRKARIEPSDIGKDYRKWIWVPPWKWQNFLKQHNIIAQSVRPFSDFPALVELQP